MKNIFKTYKLILEDGYGMERGETIKSFYTFKDAKTFLIRNGVYLLDRKGYESGYGYDYVAKVYVFKIKHNGKTCLEW